MRSRPSNWFRFLDRRRPDKSAIGTANSRTTVGDVQRLIVAASQSADPVSLNHDTDGQGKGASRIQQHNHF
jgi:hypothetical protein